MLHSRRDALRYAGAALTGVAAAVALPAASGSTTADGEPELPSGSAPALYTGSFVSAARQGAKTTWAIARPAGSTGSLRPVIALHGRNGNATGVMDMGLQQGLTQAIKVGWPPFAVVSVDGGATEYWHRRASGSDAGAMVINELLPMLANEGIDSSRVGLLGWSMGGYGALRLGAILGPARTAGICAVSPALWTSYGDVDQGAFDGYEDWARNNVFGLPALSRIPIRIDCGTSDRFCTAAKQFANSLGRVPAGGFWDGGHNVSFWQSLMAADLTWLASLLTA
jgi:enterochelin esterase-like enzyme